MSAEPSAGTPRTVSAAVSAILVLLTAAAAPVLTPAAAVAQETGEPVSQSSEQTGEESEMAPSPPVCPDNAAEVTLTVPPKPWKKNDTIGVDPETAEVYFPETRGRAAVVCWVAEGLEDGMNLHLQGKPDQEDLFPDAERTIRPTHPIGMSGRPAKLGAWRYELWVTEEGSTEKFLETDPEILVRTGGGG